MKRESWLFAGLFAASLGLAWWASMPTSSKESDRTAVVSLVPAQIATIEFVSSEFLVSAKVQGEDRWWFETTNVKTSAKDGFLGSSKVKEVLNQFSPLEAIRSIGVVKDDGLGEYGLNAGTKTLKILDKQGAELLSLAIGKQAYGTHNIFVQNLKDKNVLLMTGDFVLDLEKADLRLYERTYTNVQMEEIQSAVITQNSKSKKLVHTRRDDKGALVWTTDTAEGAANAAAKSWFERLDRARIVSYAKEQELEALKAAKPIFELDLVGTGAATDHLVFAKLAVTPGTGSGLASEYYVQSKFLGTWAKVASARLEPVEKDLPTVITN